MSLRLAELIGAVESGDAEKVRALARAGGANYCDADGVSLLSRAVSHGHHEVAAALLGEGQASPLGRDQRGFGPLHRACWHELPSAADSLAMVKLLLRHGADPNDRNPHPFDGGAVGTGRTPLILASIRGHAGVVRELVLAGADVDYRDARGMSALDYAALNGRYAVVQYLLSVGATADTAVAHAATGREGAATVGDRITFGDISAVLCAPTAPQSLVSF